MSRLISRRSISRLHNYYCTGDNTLQRKKKRKYHRTFAKRVFMLFNVFYVSRLLISSNLSAFFHMAYTAPEATNANRISMSVFSLSFVLFLLFPFSLWHAQHLRLRMQSLDVCFLLSLPFFTIYSKASSFPVSLMRLHISLFCHVQFFTLVESMLRNYPHRRLFPMRMSVCNRTK